MRTRREVLEIFQDEHAETGMLAKRDESIVDCFLEPNLDEGITALKVMGISEDNECVT